jgi:hypothetical protein
MSIFQMGFRQGRAFEQTERERVQYLNSAPVPKNAPALMVPTRCEVLRAFCVRGERMEPGAEVTLERHTALSLAAIGKVRVL